MAHLRDRQLLLLDNFEHVSAAAPLIAEILVAAPQVKALATSRRALQLYGEQEFAVPPLTLPNLRRLPDVSQLLAYEAVALFVRRLQAADPAFEITSANAQVVATICARLDGLPLAIELAAARGKLLDPPGLLARLTDRLGLLTWGPDHIPARQQSLRNTLDWSYGLLDPAAQSLLAQIAVFMGGCTLAAVEAVCQRDAPEPHAVGERRRAAPQIADSLMTLLTHSLLSSAADSASGRRFTILETIRQYAEERLREGGAQDAVLRRHAAYYLTLVEEAAPELTGPAQGIWLAQLETEHDNIRAALGRALAMADATLAGRLCRALWHFWVLRGHLSEGRMWIDAALVHAHAMAPALLADVLAGGGRLAREQGELALAAAQLTAGLALWREIGDAHGTARALGYLGVVAYDEADFDRAAVLHGESLALRRQIADRWGIAATLTNLGEVARQQGDQQRALALQEQSLALFRDLGDAAGEAAVLLNMGLLQICEYDDAERAGALLRESLVILQALGDEISLAECLEGLASVAAQRGLAERAILIASAAAAIRATRGAPLATADRARYEGSLNRARAALDADDYARAWAAGQELAAADAVAAALSF